VFLSGVGGGAGYIGDISRFRGRMVVRGGRRQSICYPAGGAFDFCQMDSDILDNEYRLMGGEMR